MEEGMIQLLAMAARVACARMTTQHLTALRDSVEQASCLARSQWERKAAAHAEFFTLLAEVVDPGLGPVLRDGAAGMHDLMLAVGRSADGMIAGSRQRLLAYIRAGDGDGAALEMEDHLRVLHFMWRLTYCSAGATSTLAPVGAASKPARVKG
jgi:DNA-binding GntR family transcriptional regulator